ncbi:MAG: hypothetical protein JJE25_13390 [Bacteroidia bacterium]|nr:hypothetical protein [Bacteroidia bacterium]
MKKLFHFLILLLFSYSVFAQCKPIGNATKPEEQHLNIEKNKSAEVISAAPKTYLLTSFIKKKLKPDRDKFAEDTYASVTGYIVDFKEEGKESCNCGKASKKKKTGDVHIYLGLVPDAAKKNCMIVEITPSFKKLHPDYATMLSKGSKVKITGYLIYDFLHEGQSLTTCTSCKGAWRKTCWEIHPVVSIERM